MKKNITLLILLLLLTGSCGTYRQDLPIARCDTPGQVQINSEYSKAAEVKAALSELTGQGVPGCAIAVYSEEGWWTASFGLARIEDQTPMQLCHLHYLQSVAKTYMAVVILKLYEQGKIDLDASITRYLPRQYSRYVTDAESITVRMLLNHTSGIPEYNFAPAYVSRLLQHPDRHFMPEDYLRFIGGKPLDFAPGSRHAYRNTNYVLLAFIADAVTGDHTKAMSELVFKPLGLSHTFYRGMPGYLDYPELVNAYWDRYSDGILENSSRIQRNNVSDLTGDDGIVTTPVEAVLFLRGLMEGKLLSAATLEAMKTWAANSKGEPEYGLGLDYAIFQEHPAYGHSGGGIGAGCQLYYFPDKKLYVFTGINLGTVTDSPLHKEASKTVDKLYKALLE